MRRGWLANDPAEVAQLVSRDLVTLQSERFRPTLGDMRCIALGHLIRLAAWHLRAEWERALPTKERLAVVDEWVRENLPFEEVLASLHEAEAREQPFQLQLVREHPATYGDSHDIVSF